MTELFRFLTVYVSLPYPPSLVYPKPRYQFIMLVVVTNIMKYEHKRGMYSLLFIFIKNEHSFQFLIGGIQTKVIITLYSNYCSALLLFIHNISIVFILVSAAKRILKSLTIKVNIFACRFLSVVLRTTIRVHAAESVWISVKQQVPKDKTLQKCWKVCALSLEIKLDGKIQFMLLRTSQVQPP